MIDLPEGHIEAGVKDISGSKDRPHVRAALEKGLEVFEVDVAEVVEPEAVQRRRRLREVVRFEAFIATLGRRENDVLGIRLHIDY